VTGGDVRERILEAIDERGPIPFDAFMELALYGEGGYFEGAPVGREGDFVTSPHVHPWFAYGIALALGELREALVATRRVPASSPAHLIELGAGDGTLARQLLQILADAGPIEYTAVERGARSRTALSSLGVTARASIDELGALEGALIVANELLDNLPFRRVRRRGGALVEVLIGRQADRLVEVEAQLPSDPAPLAPSIEDGAETTIPSGALALIDALAERMRDAYALLIDYSAERGTEVHGYRKHRQVANLLDAPGSNDLTAGVDLDLVETHAADRGLAVLGRVTQRDALLALGFAGWATRGREASTALDPAAAARAWAARSRATLLVEPDGLGAHRWLLLGTAGLPAPPWLTAARDRRSPD
jgi:SAM-dependent MidA family methyltransferase